MALGVAWEIVARLGMFAAAWNLFAPDVWIVDTLRAMVYAAIFLGAVVLAEALARPGAVWPYFLAALVAAVVTTLVALNAQIQWSDATHEGGRRMMAAFARGRASAGAMNVTWHMGFVVFGTLATLVYAWIRQTRLAEGALREAEVARTDSQRRLLAARLEAAQAQIDPSVVLDRLTEIEVAYETDRTAADAMLDELIAFLRAAIPKLRSTEAEAAAPPVATP